MDKEQYSICTTDAIITPHILLKNRLPCFAFLFHHWTYYSSKLWLFKENFGVKTQTIFHLCFSFQKKKKSIWPDFADIGQMLAWALSVYLDGLIHLTKLGYHKLGLTWKVWSSLKPAWGKHSTGKCVGETAGLYFYKDCLAVLL